MAANRPPRIVSGTGRWWTRDARGPADCDHEPLVIEAITNGTWPHGCDRELTEHAAGCRLCRDLASVATALREDSGRARHEARGRLPSSGIVWWRATVRARAEASRAADRPISVAQGVAGACAVGLACGVAGAAWQSLEWLRRTGTVIAALEPSRADIAAASALILEHAFPLVLGLGACLVIAPLALYLVLSDD
jgi:hypothetical protein